MNNQRINALTQKEVTRKEFLGISGLAIASVFGFGTIIKLVTGKSLTNHGSSMAGYGSNAYGGSKTR